MISATMRRHLPWLREPTLRMAWLRARLDFWHLVNEIGWWITNWGDDIRDWAWEASEVAVKAYTIEDEELRKVVYLDERR